MNSERLRHGGFMYESDDEYVTRSLTFLKEGLDAGEGCIVVHTRDGIAMMRDALGHDAERVSFVDAGSVYTRPARALSSYYGTLLRELRDAPSVRAVADLQIGPFGGEWDEWVGYEALTNLAYSHLPAWVVCSYDANAVPDAVLEEMSRTHAEVLDDGWRASERFEDPRELVRRLTPAPLPLPQLRLLPASVDLERFRERLARELMAEKLPEATALDMLVAATEVAANAVQHGGGIEEVRIGSVAGRFVCEVVDRGGGFDDPAAGYIVPRAGTGSGLWVARQLTWRLESFHSPRGFTVRLWI
ncbi:MAG TPA: sensor histidine kinase [Thermoleophilaceae bacterium]|jgi:anti-sigma regulatory factor (Ser/Thr protein kinase)|nr:sensor histidine kinase [Thermoleophilaceae bacterium]